MLDVLAHRVYRHLFLAQVIALIGTGLTTVALALLAHDLAEGQAGVVLGTALAIKMVAYVGISPLVGAYASRLPRRTLLVSLDLMRAAQERRETGPPMGGGPTGDVEALGGSYLPVEMQREADQIATVSFTHFLHTAISSPKIEVYSLW